jgi:GNAT superfamily N-acetyltransferase
MNIIYKYDKNLPEDQVIALYSSLKWSSSNRPKELINALAHSHTVVSAWDGNQMVALGNALSDGYLVVYYPHLLVLPEYQGKGIGRRIVSILQAKYADLHQQILVADAEAIDFYKNCGFRKAGSCEPLWIYDTYEHN